MPPEKQVRVAEKQVRAAEMQVGSAGKQIRAAEIQVRPAEKQVRAAEIQVRAAEIQVRAAEIQVRDAEQQVATVRFFCPGMKQQHGNYLQQQLITCSSSITACSNSTLPVAACYFYSQCVATCNVSESLI